MSKTLTEDRSLTNVLGKLDIHPYKDKDEARSHLSQLVQKPIKKKKKRPETLKILEEKPGETLPRFRYRQRFSKEDSGHLGNKANYAQTGHMN